MGAIGLNPIRLDRIGLDPIRINAIKLGVPGASGTDRPYIDPEVLASLKAVCICYGKSNDDPDRAVVKNLVDPDNPFVISNAAFKLNSGFGKYEVDFLDSSIWNSANSTITSSKIDCKNAISHIMLLYYNVGGKEYPDIPSFKVIKTGADIDYSYIDETGSPKSVKIVDGVNVLPASYNTLYSGSGRFCGFGNPGIGNSVTITQIPSFEGAFVTDGIDDLITSTKTVYEMLDDSKELTVVSMTTCLSSYHYSNNTAFTNYIRNDQEFIRSYVTNANDRKCGIYGYSISNIDSYNNTAKVINNVLGDKEDYKIVNSVGTSPEIWNSNFSIVGYLANNDNIVETSQVAWYWTIIANKVLTTDQINQVIAYFNLDRTLNPDILCDVKKQGITNENHAEFGDKLIDFSDNGRDIQLNNIAWDGDSGIGKYNYPNWKVKATVANTYSTIVNYPTVNGTYSINVNGVSELMQSIGLHLEVKYTTSTGVIYNDIKQDGVYSYILPDGATDLTLRFGGIPGIVNEPCNIIITQIPSHAGALCLDGVNDFGQFVGDLGLKDYTFIMDREYLSLKADQVPVISSINPLTDTPFIFEHCVYENKVARPFSFGKDTVFSEQLVSKRLISYQSTYKYNGKNISKGTSVNTGSGLTIGRYGDDRQYANFAFYFLMLFPYSMSEFLIERQLKKHKLGTLYPDMVEFRPIVKSNLPYSSISYSVNPGEYISVDSMVTITVTLPNTSDKLMEVSCNAISDISISGDNGVYEITGKVVKSPQKINIVISSYLTMLSNSTLISNETLIKNE